jgi:23S rRNA pseudouridine2457 synthase
MSRLLLFNKPYGVISQFSADGKHATLKDYIPVAAVYPAGRLDTDSEGLLLLTDDGQLQHRLSHPRHKLPKTYWAQVEGIPDAAALDALRRGVDLGDFVTQPARARLIPPPADLWERTPPIRQRLSIPTHWLELVIEEGKNRQVRRMTAKVGFPTLRLVRARLGPFDLAGLAPGQWREVSAAELGPVSQTPRATRGSAGETRSRRPAPDAVPPGKTSRGRAAVAPPSRRRR